MPSNIILIGMPGAGTSTVGVLLAKTLGLDFLDTDLLICRKKGTTLQHVLNQEGLEAFLDLEEQVVTAIHPEATVVATGGSVPMRPAAMTHLKALGTIVYLEVPLEELRARISNITTRGIAFGPGETLDMLYEKRTPVYRQWADITIQAQPGSTDLEATVARLAAELLTP